MRYSGYCNKCDTYSPAPTGYDERRHELRDPICGNIAFLRRGTTEAQYKELYIKRSPQDFVIIQGEQI